MVNRAAAVPTSRRVARILAFRSGKRGDALTNKQQAEDNSNDPTCHEISPLQLRYQNENALPVATERALYLPSAARLTCQRPLACPVALRPRISPGLPLTKGVLVLLDST
jgi:hypothetical protein